MDKDCFKKGSVISVIAPDPKVAVNLGTPVVIVQMFLTRFMLNEE